jgi:membrane protein implicated in regulation of membrane protease activity
MIEFLQNMTQYHWLTFACVIVILEIFGAGGFMLGFSLAALVVFAIMCFMSITWQVQLIIFAVISIIASITWYLYQNKKDSKDEETTTLNKKENQFLGQKITLGEDIEVGKGRVKFGDTTWPVYTEEALKAGDVVEVVKVNGIFLHIQKV